MYEELFDIETCPSELLFLRIELLVGPDASKLHGMIDKFGGPWAMILSAPESTVEFMAPLKLQLSFNVELSTEEELLILVSTVGLGSSKTEK